MPNRPHTDHIYHSAFVADSLLRYYSIRLRGMIVIEPMLFDRAVQSEFLALKDRTSSYNKKRTVLWKDVEEAMVFHKKRQPWNTWAEETLQWMAVSGYFFVCCYISSS